jgi:hypothetical protein
VRAPHRTEDPQVDQDLVLAPAPVEQQLAEAEGDAVRVGQPLGALDAQRAEQLAGREPRHRLAEHGSCRGAEQV